MPYIRTVPPGRADRQTAEVYRYMEEVGGSSRIANVVQLFSLRPASMQRMVRSWELAMWSGDEPRANREFVAAAVSRYADCHY